MTMSGCLYRAALRPAETVSLRDYDCVDHQLPALRRNYERRPAHHEAAVY
jgi:hypothetical protein